MKTLDSLVNEIERRVKENIPVSPSNWIEVALQVNALKGDLDNQIAEYEGDLASLEAKYIEEGKPQSTAKALAKNNEGYKDYLKAKAKAKRVDEFLRLAKKRSMLNEYNL
ncbi:MAG: hypothetical protein GY841_00735 [FCB group bacterium]|nr:hypothetical protein [FCB group bacterium]